MNQVTTPHSVFEYLVEMTFTPFGTLPTPAELVSFSERFVLPTLSACQEHLAAGRIVAGGPTLAATGFSFIARTSSAQELEEMVGALPLWPRAQTRVVPLGTFELRAANVRRRLEQARARLQPSAEAAPSATSLSVSKN